MRRSSEVRGMTSGLRLGLEERVLPRHGAVSRDSGLEKGAGAVEGFCAVAGRGAVAGLRKVARYGLVAGRGAVAESGMVAGRGAIAAGWGAWVWGRGEIRCLRSVNYAQEL